MLSAAVSLNRLEYQLVKKGEEPKGFEDLANPKWKGSLMGEGCDYQLLLGLAKAKYQSDDKAIDLVMRIALNQVEFHRGHSQLIEFLVARQRPVCFTCYAQQFPPRMKKGSAHPNVKPMEKVRPANAYMLGQDDVKEFPKHEKIWKDIFQIR